MGGSVLRTHQHIFDYNRLHKGSAASPPSDEGLVNLCGVLLPERVPEHGSTIRRRNQPKWDAAAEKLRTVFDESTGSDYLAHVVWRLGREAGQVRKIMNECGIMWGYFFDHDAFSVHNNSEPNNLVLLPKGTNPKT